MIKKFSILIFIVITSLSLSGCATLMGLASSLGGGTSSSEKGHGNDNEVLIGSEKTNGVNIGDKTELDTDDVNGDINTGKKSEINSSDIKGDVNTNEKNTYTADSIAIGITWWQLTIIITVISLIIIIVVFLMALFMRSPRDKKLMKELKK